MSAQNWLQTMEPEQGWFVEERTFRPEYIAKYETIFTQGNGYLGQRAALEEPYWGQTRNLFVSGTFDRFCDTEVSELPNLPDVTNIGITVNSSAFSVRYGVLKHYRRWLDLRSGEVCRQVEWDSPEGIGLRLQWRRTVSMADVHLQCAQVTVETDAPVELSFTSGIDGRVSNSGTQHTIEGDARVYDGRILEYPCKTLNSCIQIVTHAAHQVLVDGVPVQVPMKIVTARRYVAGTYTLRLEPGQVLTFEKLSYVCTGRDLEYRDLHAQEANRQVLAHSLDRFRKAAACRYEEVARASEAVWSRFWQEQDVRIDSRDPFDQVAIRFAIYHLNIMTNHRDNRMGVGAKGLSGEGYKGHSFWDTEIFIFPFFQFTQPDVGRNLLEYRYQTLNAARKLARENGYEGAMFPWESGWIEEGDVTPKTLGVDLVTGEVLICDTGEMEHHVTADIAYAIYQYYMTTGDEDFMERCGYELLLETARFWASRVEWNAERSRYEILHVIGPDEYQVNVNNNAYTNYLAGHNMELGLWALGTLEANPALFRRLSEILPLARLREVFRDRLGKLYLPKPVEETGILPQFDGYLDQQRLDLTAYRNAPRVAEIMKDFNFQMLRKYQAAKQADVVQLMFLREELFPGDLRRKNYGFYEPRTLHDSSLSKTIHSILASDLGMMEEAYHMFLGAAKTDLGPEPDSCDAGIHSANMGGMWQAVVMGFGGLRLHKGRLRISPHLPESWSELNYRVRWRNRLLDISVRKESLWIANHGPALTLEVMGREETLPANSSNEFSRPAREHQEEPKC